MANIQTNKQSNKPQLGINQAGFNALMSELNYQAAECGRFYEGPTKYRGVGFKSAIELAKTCFPIEAKEYDRQFDTLERECEVQHA